MICFDQPEASCLPALNRSAGPAERTFDFTPAFFAERCGRPSLPPQLDETCGAQQRECAPTP